MGERVPQCRCHEARWHQEEPHEPGCPCYDPLDTNPVSPGDSAPASPEPRDADLWKQRCRSCGSTAGDGCPAFNTLCPRFHAALASLTERAERVVAEAVNERCDGITLRRASEGKPDAEAAVARAAVAALADAGLLAPAPTSEEESK